MTEKEKNLTGKEEEEKDTARFKELNDKPEADRTDDDKKEIGELKERYGKRMQDKINKLNWQSKSAIERAEKAEQEAKELREKLTEKEKPEPKPEVKEQFTEIGGQKYFTDEALKAKVDAGEISEADAYRYQRRRDKEEIKVEIREEQSVDAKKKEDAKIRKEDWDKVNEKYPNFSSKHPDHDPNDPLYKKANELYKEGYAGNPKGLSLAIKRAREILRMPETQPDRSGDFSVEEKNIPSKPKGGKEQEVTLTPEQEEAAVRQWTRGDVLNPRTGKAYTPKEALAKALEAKKARLQKEE